MRTDLNINNRLLNTFISVTGIENIPELTGISIDSRSCKKGDLYVALAGERVDGHDFVNQAYENGATAALLAHPVEADPHLKQLIVDDPLKTVGSVAQHWRQNFNIPVIGITGSNGKTSTKDLLTHILKSKFTVHSTFGNWNTTISLPITVLGINSTHEISVLEMGASAIGEISYLSSIAHPTHGLITNIAPAHLEGFGSVENIKHQKGALFQSLNPGTAFVNNDDEHVRSIGIMDKKITFGTSNDSDFHYTMINGDNSIILELNGDKIDTASKNMAFAKNCMAVTTISLSIGIDLDQIKERILSAVPTKGRCEVKRIGHFTVIDDSYNANLQSTISAIDFLKDYNGTGRKILIFGDMKELGNDSEDHHSKIGIYSENAGIDGLITVGNDSKYANDNCNLQLNIHFDDHPSLAHELKSIVSPDDIILLKGSRSMNMDSIIPVLEKI